jgi:lipid A disaccharide synthetase
MDMSTYVEAGKEYIKAHWMGILIGAIPTIAVAVVSLINIFIAFRVDYEQLRQSVNASTVQLQMVAKTNQQLLQNDAQIKQEQQDQGNQLVNIQSDVQDIHRYFFDGHNGK